jgi:hypothetical protein
MATITTSSVATQAGARPQLLAFLRTLVERSHETSTPSAPVATPAATPAPHTTHAPLAGSWQDAWIDKHAAATHDGSKVTAGQVTLHPIATAVRAVRAAGQWDLPKPDQTTEARRVMLHDTVYEVAVAPEPIVPINVTTSSEGWIVSGSTEPWGHPLSPRLREVLDNLKRGDAAWAPVYSTCVASELASSLVFGPYNDRFATYSEAAAAAPPDGFVLSLASEPMSAEMEALGFGSPVSVGTNLPSTHRPITRAGRTSK